MRNRFIIEALGAFFLGCAVMMCEAPLPVAALLAALLYLGAPFSGGHYNPAVTLAVWLRGRLPGRQVWSYLAAQVTGAVLAAFLVGGLLGYDHEHAKDAMAALGDDIFAGAFAGAVAEFLGVFFLASVFLFTTTSRLTSGNSYFGLAVALAFLAMTGVFGQFNPLFNPIGSLALALQGLTSSVFGEGADAGAFAKEVVFLAKLAPRTALDLAAQLAGGLAAAGLFRGLCPEDR